MYGKVLTPIDLAQSDLSIGEVGPSKSQALELLAELKLSKSEVRVRMARLRPLGYGATAFSRWRERRLVGLGRVELPTSPLSGVRSSQLSYRPASNDKAMHS